MSILPTSVAARPIQSPWQKAYLRFRDLERRLTDASEGPLRTLLYKAASGRYAFDPSLQEFLAVCRGSNPGMLREPPPDLVKDLQDIADLRSSYDPDAPGFSFADVYHLAFHNLVRWWGYGESIPLARECPRLYRGQRNDTWDIGAKIYRGLPSGPGREPELRIRATNACRLAHTIAARLGLPFIDAMAVAQHYSDPGILGVPTWLVDFSRNPWVALFFASDGGQTGEFGVVWEIDQQEYAQHAAGGGNPLGGLQLIVPHSVQRIENQAGVFVVAGLPQIFEQYVAFGRETRFQQHTGLLFADPVLGISAGTIYPPDDPLPAVLAEIAAAVVDCGCGPGARPCAIPPEVFADFLDPETYERLLIGWLDKFQAERAGHTEPPGMRAALTVLARFHSLLYSPAYVGRLPSRVSRSFNRLRDAFGNLCLQASGGKPVSVRDVVMETYVQQMRWDGDHVTVLLEVLEQVAPSGNAP